MAQKANVPYRIGSVGGWFMIGMAFIADAIQIFFTMTVVFAPVGDVITVLVEGLIGIWFLLQGIVFFSGKKSLSNVGTILTTTIIELIPLVNALPTLGAGTYMLIRNSRKEDEEKFEETLKAANDTNRPRFARRAA